MLRVVKHLKSIVIRAEVEVTEPSGDHSRNFMYALSLLMEAGYFPHDLASYLSPGMAYRLISVSKAAEDSMSASESTHLFTSKPDGERMWAIRMGSVWFMVRPYHRTKVAALLLHHCMADYVHVGPVVDCEATADGAILLIDILLNERGELTDRNKALDSMLLEARQLMARAELFEGLSIREYIAAYGQALNYSQSPRYPTDRVIVVSTSNMYTRKIKAQRSMELQATEAGLVSSDGQRVGELVGGVPYPEGTIVELRLAPLVSGLRLPIDEILVRGDKRVANTADDTSF